jgi:hypothetical protein
MKFEIHFEFRASLRKFQDLNFWDATSRDAMILSTRQLIIDILPCSNIEWYDDEPMVHA